MGKIEYIRCPRCELNYIDKREKLCKVCQAELKAKGSNALIDDDIVEPGLCPICKTNYITDDEEICAECAKERQIQNDALDTNTTESEDNDDSWRMYVENDDKETEEDEFGDMSSISDGSDIDGDDLMSDDDLAIDDDEPDDADEEADSDFDDDDDDFDDDYDEDDDDLDDDDDDLDDDDDEDDEMEKVKKHVRNNKK